MNKFFRNGIIYLLLLVGYILIYVIDIEHVIYPETPSESRSKVDFVYQQF